MGELFSSNHIAIACHRRGNPAGGPPSKGRPAPATPRLSCRQRHSGAGCGAGSPALGGGAGSAPAHAHGPHTRERTPRRAHARTPGRTHSTPGYRRALSSREWGHSRIPLQRRRRPPRPAPPLELASSRRRSVGCKLCSVRQSRERAGAGSAGLHAAPDSC